MHIYTKYEDTGSEDKNYCAPHEVVFYKNKLFYFAVKGQGHNDLFLYTNMSTCP